MSSSLFRRKSIAQIQADAAAGFETEELVPGAPGEPIRLRRSLGTFDLTMLGIAAIIGAGIFAMVGNAANKGGPAVVLLFVFAAIACGFAALVLCRIRVEDTDRRLGLYLCIRELWRTAGVDNRLGPSGRIRHRQHRRRHLVERLFHEPARIERHHDPAELDDGLPDRPSRL